MKNTATPRKISQMKERACLLKRTAERTNKKEDYQECLEQLDRIIKAQDRVYFVKSKSLLK